MTNDFLNYSLTAADWRKQLQINQERTKLVLGVFVLIYLAVGLLVDIYTHTNLDNVTLVEAASSLLTFKVLPVASIIMVSIAIISILITFALHDKIMLLGTSYREITEKNANSLEEKQLYNVVGELQMAASLRYLPKIYIIDASYMNAFASGYSEKSAMIAITQGLLQKLSRSELQAVIAHEMSHIRHQDIKLTLAISVLSNIMIIAIDVLFRFMLFGDRRKRDNNNLFIIITILRFVLPLLTVVLCLYLSRTREFMADAGSVELTRDNNAMVNALIKISDDHTNNQEAYSKDYNLAGHEDVRRASYIFDPTQAGIKMQQSMASMFSTHPPLQQRLAALGIRTQKKF